MDSFRVIERMYTAAWSGRGWGWATSVGKFGSGVQ